MTSLIRFDPFDELRGMRRAMDRMFNDLMGVPGRALEWEGVASFPADMYETDDSVVVRAALPGLKASELDISVQGDVLTIKGETKREENVEKDNYYRRELRYGAVSRTLALPVSVQHENAEASFEDGVLTVRLPKAEEVRPKTIKIHPKELKETIAAES